MGHMKKSWGKTIKTILGVLRLPCQMGSSWEVQPVSVLRSAIIFR